MDSNTDLSMLRAELIKHLSKEIEVLSTNMISTRLRAAFTVWIGPFILLGAVVIRVQAVPTTVTLDRPLVASFALLLGLYLLIAYVGGEMEHYVANKCNEWRDLIAAVAFGSDLTLESFQQSLRDSYLAPKVRRAYAGVFAVMFVSFMVIVFIIAHVGVKP